MLRCYHLQGQSLEAEFVEVSSKHVEVMCTPASERTEFTSLNHAHAQVLSSDSQVQERLQGKALVACIYHDAWCLMMTRAAGNRPSCHGCCR